MFLALTDVSFSYEGSPAEILSSLAVSLPGGWTGVVGPNGSGKTTLMRIAAGELRPTSGAISRPGDAVYCPQPTELPPAGLEEFALDWGAEAGKLRSVLGIGDDWPWRFGTLSHGERKRLQLAVALWRMPHVLAVDEPTNHLDASARQLVMGALRTFDGIGLLVSHDRGLLDALTERSLFLAPGRPAVLRPGSYSVAKMQAEIEGETAARERENAKRELARLRRAAARRRVEADRAHSARSKRNLDPKDRDGKGRIGLAILTGKDGQAGRLSAQLAGRLRLAEARLDSTFAEKVSEGTIWLPEGYSARRTAAELPAIALPLGPGRTLEVPALAVGPRDRIAIVGPNGAGKSTLVGALLKRANLEPERVLYLPQEVSAEESAALLAELAGLQPEVLGRVLSVVARLGSSPASLLGGRAPSPGETRKLMLALGTLREPHLVVMDEPTNHLDLPSTEALEDALAECPCALVLVSHDAKFVERLADVRWELWRDDDGVSRLRER